MLRDDNWFASFQPDDHDSGGDEHDRNRLRAGRRTTTGTSMPQSLYEAHEMNMTDRTHAARVSGGRRLMRLMGRSVVDAK